MNNKQLTPTKKQLRDIGFKRVYKARYEIPCLNGVFLCNVAESIYTWYQRIDVGEGRNFIHLDIIWTAELSS